MHSKKCDSRRSLFLLCEQLRLRERLTIILSHLDMVRISHPGVSTRNTPIPKFASHLQKNRKSSSSRERAGKTTDFRATSKTTSRSFGLSRGAAASIASVESEESLASASAGSIASASSALQTPSMAATLSPTSTTSFFFCKRASPRRTGVGASSGAASPPAPPLSTGSRDPSGLAKSTVSVFVLSWTTFAVSPSRFEGRLKREEAAAGDLATEPRGPPDRWPSLFFLEEGVS